MKPAPIALRSADLTMRLFSLGSRRGFIGHRQEAVMVQYHTTLDQFSACAMVCRKIQSIPEQQMSQRPIVKAIGAISGTSMDGIDVSIVETDGDTIVNPGPGRTFSYSEDLRKTLQGLIAQPERAQSEPLEDLELAVTDAHVAAIRRFMTETGILTGDVSLIGFHGQTVY